MNWSLKYRAFAGDNFFARASFYCLYVRSGHGVFGGAVSTVLRDLLSRHWGLTVGNSPINLCLDLA